MEMKASLRNLNVPEWIIADGQGGQEIRVYRDLKAPEVNDLLEDFCSRFRTKFQTKDE